MNFSSVPMKVRFFAAGFLLGSLLAAALTGLWLRWSFRSNLVAQSSEALTEQPTGYESSENAEQEGVLYYRSQVYPLSFSYPQSSFYEEVDGQYSTFGQKLGFEEPYQKITIADQDQITISIWNAKHPVLSREKMSTELSLNGRSLFTSGGYIIEVALRPARENSELMKIFTDSLIVDGFPLNTTSWAKVEGDAYTLQVPSGWTIEKYAEEGILTLRDRDKTSSDPQNINIAMAQVYGPALDGLQIRTVDSTTADWEKTLLRDAALDDRRITNRQTQKWGTVAGKKVTYCYKDDFLAGVPRDTLIDSCSNVYLVELKKDGKPAVLEIMAQGDLEIDQKNSLGATILSTLRF